MSHAATFSEQVSNGSKVGPTISIHDADFRSLVTIPLAEVHHLPPAHLEISRLVLCRKYDPADPTNSCAMGDACKFVHANVAHLAVTRQSIHVNYAWRSLEHVKEPRLEAGELITVMAPNGRQPAQQVPSEFLLATAGAINRHQCETPLAHCAHYYFNRMCNRGDRCNFIHSVFIDPNAADWQRAPPRAGAGYADRRSLTTPLAPARDAGALLRFHSSANPRGSTSAFATSSDSEGSRSIEKVKTRPASDGASSCDLSDNDDASLELSSNTAVAPVVRQSLGRMVYVHNPYSLLNVTRSWVEA